MSYYASKFFWLAAQPLSLAFFAVVIALVLGWVGWRRLQATFLLLSAGILFVTLYTSAGTVMLQVAPVSFDASTLEVWGPLLNGGKLVVYAEAGVPSASGLGRVIGEAGVNAMWLTASLYNALIDEAPESLRGVEQLLIGGEALSVAHVRRGLAARGAGA